MEKMRRSAVALVVLLLLALCPALHAADLHEGWYMRVNGPQVYTDVDGRPELRADGQFTTPFGVYGPFTVSSGGFYPSSFYRYVSVDTDAFGVGPDDSLVLPLTFGMGDTESFLYMRISWATNYDPTHVFLEFWRIRMDGTEERVWSQQTAGPTHGSADILYNATHEGGFYFKVNVVPEPSSVAVLSGLVGGMSAALRFKRRR